ncbi:hypothetical protein [Desulfobacula sp.]|jgi:hypothetical protein|uniref:hypothetical protein n=2 Tax=Desulfobacula sp. TaxID=2593537 RepID=UPI001D40B172|nr:hypothetical protein [Desulfobacula sp.]MBT3487597.1 hypothetical protein [Desulfobacula sp.]MBT4023653.1 hypothetical protein [Desulfobacula sp.]MBT4199890.1 hypothetical protein [Desulfobacula sp.]MBT4509148.1 hypothetical protein [Desulfobacula sp.]
MKDQLKTIEEAMSLIGELKTTFEIKPPDSKDPLLYTGVVEADVIEQITPIVEKYYGRPFKPAGKSALLKNLTDGFSKAIGGMRKDQTVFRKDISKSLYLYCAFWPWGSNPVNTTVRIGVLTTGSEEPGKEIYSIMGKYLDSLP